MRFGFSRAIAFLSSLVGMGRGQSGAAVAQRAKIRDHETSAPMVKHRHKTGGPNWLKIAINSQKHR